jgi:hypothetical protein
VSGHKLFIAHGLPGSCPPESFSRANP